MLSNPFQFVPFKEDAWAEGFCKGIAAMSSPMPSASISEEDFDAFNLGVATGSEASTNGIPFDFPCVPALEGSPGHGAGLAVDGAHLLHSAWEARHLAGLAGAFAGLLMVVVSIGVSANVALPANQVLPSLGQDITNKLISLGAGSLEFFSGVSLDLLSHDCTMLMSPVFLSFSAAEQAAINAGRPDGWLVVRWRTDQSNSFRIVATNPH